jgi:hypothetical protein
VEIIVTIQGFMSKPSGIANFVISHFDFFRAGGFSQTCHPTYESIEVKKTSASSLLRILFQRKAKPENYHPSIRIHIEAAVDGFVMHLIVKTFLSVRTPRHFERIGAISIILFRCFSE